MNDADTSPVERLRRWDEQRPGVPGEHWLAGAIGAYLLLRRSKSVAARLVSSLAGGLLVARALSGRDGAIAALKRRSEPSSEAPDYIELAAPWPYTRRVRISAPQRARRPRPSLEPTAGP